MTAQPSTSSPIFVVGMNGSGTTMMLDCLDAHGDIHGFRRETLIIPHYVATLHRYGDLDDDEAFRALWDEFRGLPCFTWTNGGEAPPLPADWAERPRSLATVVDETFAHFARGEGKRHWCEKTPMHAQHIAALHGLFPEARFVHMVRDGRSCAASFQRRWGYVPQRTIYRWKKVVDEARRQAAACGARYTEVFYEKLTQDPEPEMRRVCAFLGLAFEEAVLSPSRQRKHTGSTAASITARAPRWKKHFSARQVRQLEAIAGRSLADLGYEVDDPTGDRDPSALALRSWMVRDYLRMGVRVVWNDLRTPKDQKWDDLGGRIRSAIRQRLSSKF